MLTQALALDVLRCGVNAFLTGEPGSGKTYTLNGYLRWLRERGIPCAVTASTGIAATHLNGVTVHAWSGIGVRTVIDEAALARMKEIPNTERRVKAARVLVIDEVSMLSAATLDAVDAACRGLREDARPFGGMQVVFVGDFFQLPPVRKDEEGAPSLPPSSLADFAFMANAWREAKPVVCYLSEQHRQRDEKFLGLLAALRTREVTDAHRAVVEERCGRSALPGAVLLYAHNADVDRINEAELARVQGEAREYAMEAKGPPGLVAALTRGCTSPERLPLKVGAKVVFTRNDPEGRWVNGTLGAVVDYEDETDLPVVRTRDGRRFVVERVEWKYEDGEKVLAGVKQVPLRLAWALTVHKSQGMSLDAAHVDLSRAFAYGQGYVALSRVRALEGLTVEGFNARALEVHPGVAAKDVEFRAKSEALRARFTALTPEAVTTRQHEFIVAAGGSLPKPPRKAVPSAPRGRRKAPDVAAPKPPKKPRKDKKNVDGQPWEHTIALLKEGHGVDAVAALRGRTRDTVLSHLENAASLGRLRHGDLAKLLTTEADVVAAARAVTAAGVPDKLRDLYERLGGAYDFHRVRLARLLLRFG